MYMLDMNTWALTSYQYAPKPNPNWTTRYTTPDTSSWLRHYCRDTRHKTAKLSTRYNDQIKHTQHEWQPTHYMTDSTVHTRCTLPATTPRTVHNHAHNLSARGTRAHPQANSGPGKTALNTTVAKTCIMHGRHEHILTQRYTQHSSNTSNTTVLPFSAQLNSTVQHKTK